MLEIFVVGSFWFWTLIVAEVVLLFLFTEYENGIGASLSLFAFGAALQLCGNVNLLSYVFYNWIYLIPILAAYLLLGAGWGIFKWRNLVVNRLHEYFNLFAEFLRKKGLPSDITVLPVSYRVEWKQCIERTRDYSTGQTVADVPLARQHKARIIRWMSLWIFSATLYVFKDMVREVFQWMYAKLANFLQRLADNIYATANVKQNLEIPEDSSGQK